LFNRVGIIAKTITITEKGSQTEDTKLFTMNLDEIRDKDLAYEDTSYYHYFNDFQFLCIIFREPSKDAPLKDNKFVGIKRLVFPDFQTDESIERVYKITCDLINNEKVVESFCYKKDNSQIFNRNGTPKISLNFPKSKMFKIFVRGTAEDSSCKRWTFKGKTATGKKGIINSYPLQFWIKGSFITELLKTIKFIGEE